jgi:hypothetical protein
MFEYILNMHNLSSQINGFPENTPLLKDQLYFLESAKENVKGWGSCLAAVIKSLETMLDTLQLTNDNTNPDEPEQTYKSIYQLAKSQFSFTTFLLTSPDKYEELREMQILLAIYKPIIQPLYRQIDIDLNRQLHDLVIQRRSQMKDSDPDLHSVLKTLDYENNFPYNALRFNSTFPNEKARSLENLAPNKPKRSPTLICLDIDRSRTIYDGEYTKIDGIQTVFNSLLIFAKTLLTQIDDSALNIELSLSIPTQKIFYLCSFESAYLFMQSFPRILEENTEKIRAILLSNPEFLSCNTLKFDSDRGVFTMSECLKLIKNDKHKSLFRSWHALSYFTAGLLSETNLNVQNPKPFNEIPFYELFL